MATDGVVVVAGRLSTRSASTRSPGATSGQCPVAARSATAGRRCRRRSTVNGRNARRRRRQFDDRGCERREIKLVDELFAALHDIMYSSRREADQRIDEAQPSRAHPSTAAALLIGDSDGTVTRASDS